jgi:hypothetical protein
LKLFWKEAAEIQNKIFESTHDFCEELTLSNRGDAFSTPISSCQLQKSLVVELPSDCTFTEHVDKLVKAGSASIQTFAAMCRSGRGTDSVKTAYWPQLEHATSVWGLFFQNTSCLCNEISAIQKNQLQSQLEVE